MEEDWWADDAPEDSVPDAPKEVVISGPVESGNMLKGGVNQISEDGQRGFGDTPTNRVLRAANLGYCSLPG